MFTTIRIGIAAMAVLTSLPAHAQSGPSLLGLLTEIARDKIQSRRMKAQCLELARPDVFVAGAAGIDPESVKSVQPNREQRLAREIMAPATATLTYTGWSENRFHGFCSFNVDLLLPPILAEKLDGPDILRGTTGVVVVKRDNRWVFDRVADGLESSDNQFHDRLRPHLTAMVRERRERQDQLAEAQAAAQRREWIRTHPAEYAEQQRQNRMHAQELLNLIDRTQAVRDANQRDCLARGGVWASRPRAGSTIASPVCRYR